jgi:hypothetical protein
MKEAMEDRRDVDEDEEAMAARRRGMTKANEAMQVWRSGHHVLTNGFQGQRAVHPYSTSQIPTIPYNLYVLTSVPRENLNHNLPLTRLPIPA